MPRDANGNYTLPAGNPVVPATTISTSWGNPTMNDLGQGIQDSLDRFGRGGMLAPLKFADGVVGIPGFAWTNEPASGFYRAGAGDMRNTVLAADRMRWTSTGVDLWDANAIAWLPLIVTATGASSFGGLERANTWTQNQTFTTAGVGIDIVGVRPRIQWWENDQIANEGRWRLDLNSKIMTLACIDDAVSSTRSVLTFTRGVGNAIASITFGNSNNNPTYGFAGTGAVSLNSDNQQLQIGALAGGDLRIYHDGTENILETATGAIKMLDSTTGSFAEFQRSSSGIFRTSGLQPAYRTIETDAALDEKVWTMGGNASGSLVIGTRSDIDGVGNNAITVSRTGTSVAVVRMFGRLRIESLDTNGALRSGTYTPTITAPVNVAASTTQQSSFSRVGDVVTVTARVTIDPTAATTVTTFELSLPIPSDLAAVNDVIGTGMDTIPPTVLGQTNVWSIAGSTGNDTALVRCESITSVANRTLLLVFQYRVV